MTLIKPFSIADRAGFHVLFGHARIPVKCHDNSEFSDPRTKKQFDCNLANCLTLLTHQHVWIMSLHHTTKLQRKATQSGIQSGKIPPL